MHGSLGFARRSRAGRRHIAWLVPTLMTGRIGRSLLAHDATDAVPAASPALLARHH